MVECNVANVDVESSSLFSRSIKENMINLKTENNRDIFIYDDVFDSHQVQKMYYFILNSSYNLKVNDDDFLEYKTKFSNTFGCSYPRSDAERFKIIEYLPTDIKKKFNISLDTCGRCLVNTITPLDTHYPHDDAGSGLMWKEHGHGLEVKWSFLYYANLKWDLEWGADTLFLTDDRTRISQIAQCIPNRIVIFDPKIPHLIRPATMAATHYRWSINMVFTD